jgi:hypothetical protein
MMNRKPRKGTLVAAPRDAKSGNFSDFAKKDKSKIT